MVNTVWLAITILSICLLVILTPSVQALPTPGEDLTHSINLDGRDNYWLYWKYDDLMITFEVHVRTSGYIGLGFSQNGGMLGSDVVTGWVKDGQTYLQDRHAVGNSMPVIDAHQDFILVSGEEIDGFTVIRFHRQLDTCDDDDMTLQEGTTHVIFAWNDVDPVDENSIEYHGPNRGSKSVVFLNAPLPPFNPDGYLSFDVRHENAALPAEKMTYYYCVNVRPPQLEKKHHVIRVRPVIEEENISVVHHLVIYQCTGEMVEERSSAFDCLNMTYSTEMMDLCYDIAFVWGTGQGDLAMPDLAGMPIGGTEEPYYYRLETHYNNPQHLEGVVDSSGLRLYYTSDLREHDVGILSIGLVTYYPPIVIPPGMADFEMHSFCDDMCSNTIPAGGIQAFGSFPHAHTAAYGIYTELIRDGVHIDHLGEDTTYDFDFQAMRIFPQEKTVLPGDQLQTTCVYDTTNRDYITWGGLGSIEEMCVNFIYYYPRMELQSCMSMTQTIDHWVDLVDAKYQAGEFPVQPTPENVLELLPSVTWTEQDLETVRSFETSANYSQYCAVPGQPQFGDEETLQPDRPTPEIRGPFDAYNPICEPGDGINGAVGVSVLTMSALLTSLMVTMSTNFLNRIYHISMIMNLA